MRVLVVDESHAVGHILASALEQDGCTVQLVRSATDAIDRAALLPPDVITLRVRCEPELLERLIEQAPVIAIGQVAPSGRVERVIGEPFYVSDVVSAVAEVRQATAPTTVPPAARR